jgi:Mce-associated membrane protein
MSPRRRIQPDETPLLYQRPTKSTRWSRKSPRFKLPLQRWKPSREWFMPVAMVVAGTVAASGITVSSYVLANQRSHHAAAMREVDVLDFVRSFMGGFTTLDPFHANAYVDRILAHATGDFAKQFRDEQNEILIQTAQAEPTKGTTREAGVERWNDDGSATVLAATDITFKTPDQKQIIDNIIRWVVTAQREGDQWKISSLQKVI